MSSRFYRKFRLLAVGALAISALGASSALTGGKTPACQCWVTPNRVTNASPYTVSGSGLPPGMLINVYIKDKVSTWIVYGGLYPGGTVGADGTFNIGPISSTIFYPSDLGTKNVSVVDANDRRTRRLCASTFSVQ